MDWAAIRRAARARRTEVEAALTGSHDAQPVLRPASEIVSAALEMAGLGAEPLPSTDSLLAGAHAVLDREAGAIWYDQALSRETTWFNLAHELGHWWLHALTPQPPLPRTGEGKADPFSRRSACGGTDILPDPVTHPLPYGEAYVSGYSPAQRREVEANVFAAELLLPCPLLRNCFMGDPPMSAASISASAGLSETVAIGQLAEALLSLEAGDGGQAEAGGTGTPPLDESQRAAAEVATGPVLVSAGPGTGKTRTLIARMAFLLESGTAPESILALTFSNRAAEEIRDRLAASQPEDARRIWTGTFHSFGLEMLRRYGVRIGLPPAPRLLDPLDAVTLLERNLARLELSEYEYLHDPALPFPAILRAISRAKDELVSPEEYRSLAERMPVPEEPAKDREAAERDRARALEVAGVYATWQHILAEEGALDFGDLVSRPVELFRSCPDVLTSVQAQYRQIMVDEYQDVNRASAVLVRMIAGAGEGLWAVGDLRQAIYRFRGASPANVASFEQDYPSGRRMSLRVNYRSRPELVRLFSLAAAEMTGVPPEPAWAPSREPSDCCVTLAEAADGEAQADGIAAGIRSAQAEGVPLGSQAVLCRTNSQIDSLAEALTERGVPVLHLGDLFSRPEVRDMLALLSLASEGEGSALHRVGGFPEYGLSPERVQDILQTAHERNVPFPPALRGVEPLSSHLEEIAYRADAYSFFSRYLFGRARYLRDIVRDYTVAGQQRRLALQQLLLTARSFTARLPADDEDHPHRAFLDHVRRLVAWGEDTRARVPEAAGADAVRVMTVHAAKGLEFPVAYVPNLAKGMFPPRAQGSMTRLPPGLAPEEEEYDEEEALFFVAMSRARDRLTVSRPLTIGGRKVQISPLLRLIHPALTEAGITAVTWSASADGRRMTEDGPSLDSDTPHGLIASSHNLHSSLISHPSSLPSDFPARDLETYMRCPRRYYYARVLRLRDADPPSAYVSFQSCVWSTLRWVQSEQAAGRTVGEPDALEYLAELWKRDGPFGHPHEPALLARAEQLVRGALHAPAASSPPSDKAELVAELPNGRVRIRPDALLQTEEGICIEKWKTGRARDGDHTAPQLALARLAAKAGSRNSNVSVRLRYLATGDVREAPEQQRFERDRVAKYDAAMAGIRAGRFSARPDGSECPRCAFWFICPT